MIDYVTADPPSFDPTPLNGHVMTFGTPGGMDKADYVRRIPFTWEGGPLLTPPGRANPGTPFHAVNPIMTVRRF